MGTGAASGLAASGSRRLARFALVGVAYAVGSQLAYSWFGADGFGASFFPAAGVTLAALVLWPRSEWPIVILAAATAAAGTALLAGCAPGAGVGSGAQSLQFWHLLSGGDGVTMSQLLDTVNTAQSDYRIRPTVLAFDWPKLAEISAETQDGEVQPPVAYHAERAYSEVLLQDGRALPLLAELGGVIATVSTADQPVSVLESFRLDGDYGDGDGEPSAHWAFAAQGLRGGGHDVVVIQLLAEDEIDPPLDGALRLVDAESGSELDVTVDEALRAAYRRRLEHRLDEVERFCRRQGIEYLRASTAIAFEDIVLKCLRQGAHVK